MLSAEMFALVAAVLCCRIASGLSDYPTGELPGLVSPLGDLDEIEYENGAVSDPSPCKFPPQYQCNVSSQAGVAASTGPRFVATSTKIYVDSTNTRVAGIGGSGNRTRGFIALFTSNNTAKVYVWNVAKQRCFTKNLSRARWRPQQVPTNATYVSTVSLGPVSSSGTVDVFRFGGRSTDNRRGRTASVQGTIMVSSSGCNPVVVQLNGKTRRGPRDEDNTVMFEQDSFTLEDEDKDEDSSSEEGVDKKKHRPGRRGRRGAFSDTIFFTDLSTSVDPSVFTPPTYCNTTTLTFNVEPLPDILQKFIEF